MSDRRQPSSLAFIHDQHDLPTILSQFKQAGSLSVVQLTAPEHFSLVFSSLLLLPADPVVKVRGIAGNAVPGPLKLLASVPGPHAGVSATKRLPLQLTVRPQIFQSSWEPKFIL